ncbi:MAG: hypothetical protein IJM51_01480 [Clostridia bacterium]|nr:hypothetical protein [Clostridia bacterium]
MRRTSKEIAPEVLLQDVPATFTPVNAAIMPQRKENKTKGNKSKVKQSKADKSKAAAKFFAEKFCLPAFA